VYGREQGTCVRGPGASLHGLSATEAGTFEQFMSELGSAHLQQL